MHGGSRKRPTLQQVLEPAWWHGLTQFGEFLADSAQPRAPTASDSQGDTLYGSEEIRQKRHRGGVAINLDWLLEQERGPLPRDDSAM
jgi:hypothetical protein